MAEDNGDKTEAATPRRRQQAEEQGQVARSQDLVAAALIVGAMVLLNNFGGTAMRTLATLLTESIESLSDVSNPTSAVEWLAHATVMCGQALWPLMLGLTLIAIVGNVIQVGFKLNTERLQPNLGALNPLKGFSRLFTGGNPMRFAMSMAKMLMIGLVAWSAMKDRLPLIMMAQGMSHQQLFLLASQTLYAIAFRIGMFLLLLAIVDYAWQRWKHERDLRMTKQEVKDEMRSMEGDPKVKQRRRQIAFQIASKRLKKDVPTADVVVTNPTEYAVALKYESATMHAPRVIAKGQGVIAARIRQLAIEAGVPILERKPLARALFRMVEVGQEVPEQFYSAIAEILAYVYELTGKAKPKVAV